MQFLRSVAATTAIAVTALPAAFAFSSLSLASSSSYSQTTSSSTPSSSISKSLDFHSLSPKPILSPNRLGLVKSFASAPTAVLMETRSSQSQNGELLPDLLTEFMVDMTCEGCVDAVKNKLETVEGVKRVDVDLSNQVVRILGTTPVKAITDALEKSGRQARLIGQGVPEDFLVSAAVAEFKGPDVFGVVRIAQVTMELARIEANFSGLSPGKHGWSINEYGDLTKGAASTGKVYNPMTSGDENELLGDLGTLDVDDKGEAFFSGVKLRLKTPDLIGRAIVVYGTEDKSDAGVMAAVIARSASVGENYKKICTCDGTTIWEATNSDFAA
ncbi:hypothetical protein Nepgr_030731 [Nepenthes gracilis]|uniref:Superoxide dismutase copper chaperone n=1 Tax=Nepenthes gracilis TaxID=150966 RepID=A0AAD3Y4I7_NEPGR|nr:hypothetical protein Nepgr_030731 [Nepenthes gracilis]